MIDGTCGEERFDLAVLAVGQRPSPATAQLAEMTGIDLNPWGFVKTDSFYTTRTRREGVFAGGSFRA